MIHWIPSVDDSSYIPHLQGLLRHICRAGFEHHVAITHDTVASALQEAMGNYLDWDVYLHNAAT